MLIFTTSHTTTPSILSVIRPDHKSPLHRMGHSLPTRPRHPPRNAIRRKMRSYETTPSAGSTFLLCLSALEFVMGTESEGRIRCSADPAAPLLLWGQIRWKQSTYSSNNTKIFLNQMLALSRENANASISAANEYAFFRLNASHCSPLLSWAVETMVQSSEDRSKGAIQAWRLDVEMTR